MAQQSEFMTYADVARKFGVPESTVRYWVHMRQGPPSYKLGRHRRFRRADVDKWAEDRVEVPEPAA